MKYQFVSKSKDFPEYLRGSGWTCIALDDGTGEVWLVPEKLRGELGRYAVVPLEEGEDARLGSPVNARPATPAEIEEMERRTSEAFFGKLIERLRVAWQAQNRGQTEAGESRVSRGMVG